MSANKKCEKVQCQKVGPKESRLNLEGVDWKEAVKKAVQKKRPKEGWPDKKKERGE